MKKIFLCILAGVAMTGSVMPTVAQDIKRSITKVVGDVYRFQNRFHYSLVTVTNVGVVVVDPINESAAQWLRDNLKQVTDKPITHLIYSHSHGDHASGGTVLASRGTQVIAHANAPAPVAALTSTLA